MSELKWKTKYKTDFGNEYDFLETLLIDNGIPKENIPGFLHPTSKHKNDPFLMDNMKQAVELVHKHVKAGSKMFVKVDCD